MIKHTVTNEKRFQPEINTPYIFNCLKERMKQEDQKKNYDADHNLSNLLSNLVYLLWPDALTPEQNNSLFSDDPKTIADNTKLLEITYMLVHRWWYRSFHTTDWESAYRIIEKETSERLNSFVQYVDFTANRNTDNKLLTKLQKLRKTNIGMANICDLVLDKLIKAFGQNKVDDIMRGAYKSSRKNIEQECKNFVLNSLLNAQNGNQVIVKNQKGSVIFACSVKHPLPLTNRGKIDLSKPCLLDEKTTPKDLINKFYDAIIADTTVPKLVSFRPTNIQPTIPLPNISLKISFIKEIDQSQVNQVNVNGPAPLPNPFYQSNQNGRKYIQNPFYQPNQYDQNNLQQPQDNNIDQKKQNEKDYLDQDKEPGYYLGKKDADLLHIDPVKLGLNDNNNRPPFINNINPNFNPNFNNFNNNYNNNNNIDTNNNNNNNNYINNNGEQLNSSLDGKSMFVQPGKRKGQTQINVQNKLSLKNDQNEYENAADQNNNDNNNNGENDSDIRKEAIRKEACRIIKEVFMGNVKKQEEQKSNQDKNNRQDEALYTVKQQEVQESGQESQRDINADPRDVAQQEEDTEGVRVLKRWIVTGDTKGLNWIRSSDLEDFVIQAENDQYARTNPNLNMQKASDDIFNRGTSWWFRSKQKKRADYLYSLIEGKINKDQEIRITIRDKKNQAKHNEDLKRRINNVYNTNRVEVDNGPLYRNLQNLNDLKDKLAGYSTGCCCCC